ncbi:hypothetical protein M6D93_01630 [Jatrophihabitans telluris]|uniref:Uncharacterized protein n=1 Tax=Jatrophihabitans telluris TaxID=2038343 RepID=A0ABY4R0B9_9ACTN|nr:hypothetical protein [Jatrophihabitans telluris]UQX88716.1 hypothetical protein M6D93_01630 [Jatrophihabitans telluris]
MHQGTLRRFVDVFSDGHEPGAGPLDRDRQLDVIGTVPGQAVDLVHDDELRGVLFQVDQHVL